MSATTTSIDPECQMLGEVEMVGRDRWEEIRRRAAPGFVEADLVAYCGRTMAGIFVSTMVGLDRWSTRSSRTVTALPQVSGRNYNSTVRERDEPYEAHRGPIVAGCRRPLPIERVESDWRSYRVNYQGCVN